MIEGPNNPQWKSAGSGPHTITVRIGDDIPDALRNDKLRDTTLRLGLDGAVTGDVLAVKFNHAMSKATVTATDGSIELPLSPAAIKQGVNRLELAIAQRGEAAGNPLTLNQARVDVRYRLR